MSDDATRRGEYVDWLVQQSMLNDASASAGQRSTVSGMWLNPFGNPDPVRAVARAPVWFTAYPASMITKPEHSFLATLSDEALWAAFETLGIVAVHAGPVKRAGSAPASTQCSEPRTSSRGCVRSLLFMAAR